MRPFEVEDMDRSAERSVDKARMSIVLVDDTEMEMFDTIGLISSLSYLLQVFLYASKNVFGIIFIIFRMVALTFFYSCTALSSC